jgi:hypothetical protein
MSSSVPLIRVLCVWLLMAFAMTANGIFRELVLRRVFAPTVAEVLSAAMGMFIILAITRLGFQPLSANTTTQLLLVAVLLVGLTIAFELAIGHYVDHKSLADLLANYAIWRGRLWPLVLAVLALTPFVWGRWFATLTRASGA